LVEAPVDDEPAEAPVYDSRCEVTAWRGYAKWRFYGRIETGNGDVALIESRPFRAPGSAGPEATPVAATACAELTARLESQGWRRVDGGERWFESIFIRSDTQDSAVRAPDLPAAAKEAL
jgi:hypothetical protein